MDGNGYLTDHYILDGDLDAAARAVLARYTTPRRGLDGSLIWVLDEVVEVTTYD